MRKTVVWHMAMMMMAIMTLPNVVTSEATYNLFMIGNSYTYYNDKAEIVEALLEESLGLSEDEVFSKTKASGGFTWYEHLNANDILEFRFKEKPWNWIVLQEQSLTPGLYNNHPYFDASVESLIEIYKLILEHSPQADTLLYMTWGRRAGSQQFNHLYPTYLDMQARITEGYYKYQEYISNATHPVKIIPTGLAFKKIYETEVNVNNNPNPSTGDNDFTNLYVNDGSHPSKGGSLLSSYCTYATMTGRDPRGLQWLPNKNVDEAFRDRLQEVAATVVSDFYQKTLIPNDQPGMQDMLAAGTGASPSSLPTVAPIAVGSSYEDDAAKQEGSPPPTEPAMSDIPSATPTVVPSTSPTKTASPNLGDTQPPTDFVAPSLLLIGGPYLIQASDYIQGMLEDAYQTSIVVEKANFRNKNLKTLLNKANNGPRSKMEENKFTWVVVQEQSQIPGLYGYGVETGVGHEEYTKSLETVVELNDLIKEHGADTCFFETWGRRNGDPDNPYIYPNYFMMQKYTSAGYVRYMEATGSSERPVYLGAVGSAIANIYDFVYDDGNNEPLNAGTYFTRLYDQDGSNLSPAGNYLAALTMYASLTGKDPRSVTYVPETNPPIFTEGLDDEFIELLQEAAAVSNNDEEFVIPEEPVLRLDSTFLSERLIDDGFLFIPDMVLQPTSAPTTMIGFPTVDTTADEEDTTREGNGNETESTESSSAFPIISSNVVRVFTTTLLLVGAFIFQ